MTAKKPKKRKNKQDATLINNRARVKEIAALKRRVKKLEEKVIPLEALVNAMLKHIHM